MIARPLKKKQMRKQIPKWKRGYHQKTYNIKMITRDYEFDANKFNTLI